MSASHSTVKRKSKSTPVTPEEPAPKKILAVADTEQPDSVTMDATSALINAEPSSQELELVLSKPIAYFSFDIEADGPCPVKNSMVSFGLVVFNESAEEMDRLQLNLKPRDSAKQDKRCMKEFWAEHPEVWKFVQQNQVSGEYWAYMVWDMMRVYDHAGYNIIWIANPAAYDWQWVKNYYEFYKAANFSDIGYSAKCMGTLWWNLACEHGLTSKEEDDIETEELKKLQGPKHMEHNPEDDARVQGKWFFQLIDPHSELRVRLRNLQAARKTPSSKNDAMEGWATYHIKDAAYPLQKKCTGLQPFPLLGGQEVESWLTRIPPQSEAILEAFEKEFAHKDNPRGEAIEEYMFRAGANVVRQPARKKYEHTSFAGHIPLLPKPDEELNMHGP